MILRFPTAASISALPTIRLSIRSPVINKVFSKRFAGGVATTGANKKTPEKTVRAVLDSEYKYEMDSLESDPVDVPKEVLNYFKKNNMAITKDTLGDSIVVLSGEKEGTKFSLGFDVRQIYLNEVDEDYNYDEDENAEKDEEEDVKEEDLNEDEEGENTTTDYEQTSDPISATLVLTRGPSSLSFELGLGSDGVTIHSMHTGALPLTADSLTSDAFTGPNYSDLSDELQMAVTGYLESFGINAELGDALRAYINVKERKEYHAWLSKVREFFR